MYDSVPQFASIVHPSGAATDVIQGVRQTFVDPRETLNGTSGVNLTTLDIGNLNTALNSGAMTGTLQSNYNGVVYIYDATKSSVEPANTLDGIRLQDGTTTPNFNDQNNNPLGFTVVSNNGVYVQGDYNTTPITVAGAQVNNPAAVMGDALTAVSQGWSLAANTSLQPMTGTTSGTREAIASTNFPGNGTYNPAVNAATANGMQINAAILTGNTPTNVAADTNSGGAQNLVRMIEDWYYNPFGPMDTDGDGNHVGLTLTLNGSLGQLFTSKYFTGAYPGSGVAHGVYIQPKFRVLNYDLNFKNRTPAGSPSTTAFTRGNYFFW
jgi:hypothetical protein